MGESGRGAVAPRSDKTGLNQVGGIRASRKGAGEKTDHKTISPSASL